MKNLLALCAIFVMVSMTGCTTMINEKMASWVGHNVNDLIASWGPPQQTMSDGQGGQILIYSQTRQWTTPGNVTTNTYGSANAYGNTYRNTYGNTYRGTAHGNATSHTTYNPPQTHGYDAQRMFWVDGNGTIYRWSWKGM